LLLDQRGTGRSAAGFRCELDQAATLTTGAVEALGEMLEECLATIRHDPRLFSTSPAVGDLDALRRALGAEEWNLYGISYGTRVAQHYARLHPERVRSMVLDGVVPAELALGPFIARDAQAALDAILARCETDPACSSRYAELGRKFEDLRLRLAAGPVSIDVANPATGEIESRLLGESDLQGVVRLMSYTAATASLLPLAISEAHRGEYGMLAAQVDILTRDLAETVSVPMHNSVVCTEDVPYFPDDLPVDPDDVYLGTTIVDSLRAICEIWPAGVIDAGFKEPLEFDGPVLLLSGENDPVTPPEYAVRVMTAGLGNARHLVGPGQGHGMAGIGCAPRLIAAFVEAASPAAVDGACLDREPPTPFFLSKLGPAP
ncbi:MAG: alpha/beta fold hydrolase, partial [Gammaproteobacteria bacterium]|nr:alpha/beta fold hydrolase [Gammaproteobacteria bacterium]